MDGLMRYVLATLDASKEDGWFEALRDLIGHLQERRVWMGEQSVLSTGAQSDDEQFLFPMAASRYSSNYDSDGGESIKGVSLYTKLVF